MSGYTLILSGNRTEAAQWAQSVGLKFRQTQFPVSADSIGRHRPARIVQLPSFATRRDRFAILSRVRNNILTRFHGIEIEEVEFTPPPPREEVLEPQEGRLVTLNDDIWNDVPGQLELPLQQDRPKRPEPKPDRSKKRPAKPKATKPPYEDPAGPVDVAAKRADPADFWQGVQ